MNTFFPKVFPNFPKLGFSTIDNCINSFDLNLIEKMERGEIMFEFKFLTNINFCIFHSSLKHCVLLFRYGWFFRTKFHIIIPFLHVNTSPTQWHASSLHVFAGLLSPPLPSFFRSLLQVFRKSACSVQVIPFR